MQKIAASICIGLLLIAAGVYWVFHGSAPFKPLPGAQKLDIIQQWDLPKQLDEVSGIAWMDENHMACVADEEGIIFIYNLQSNKIEKEIKFGEHGDYEAIALKNETAYILRSDGVIFEIDNFNSNPGKAITFETSLKDEYNFEGLCYDEANDRLLLTLKDMVDDNTKPVFSFDLKSKKLMETPAYQIRFKSKIFDKTEQKKSHRIMRPSEVAINPKNHNIYILEGSNPKLLILDSSGKEIKLIILEGDQFGQPEGMTFSPSGEVFISNERQAAPANILKVLLD